MSQVFIADGNILSCSLL